MLWTLIEKEWKNLVKSPRFSVLYGISTLLVLAATGLGIREYRAFERQQAAAATLLDEELQEVTEWYALAVRAFRAPDPLAVLVLGVQDDVGRLAPIHRSVEPILTDSVYGDEPILALFRAVDLGFVLVVVLPLFAILLTYDAVNGEREAGTLRLVFSYAVPRARYVAAKLAGLWVALAVPWGVALAAALLLVVAAGIPLDAGHWWRLLVLALAAALYLTVFVALGLAVSALTRRPRTSFLVLLALWALAVLVVPRVGLLAAAQLVPVPSAAEVASQRAGFEARAWDRQQKAQLDAWQARQAEMAGLSDDEQQAYEDAHLWQWLEEDEKAQKAVEAEIADNAARLGESVRLLAARRAETAFALSRLSPAATFQLLAMRLAGTDAALKERNEAAMREYRRSFEEWIGDRDQGGHRITIRRSRARGGSSGPLQEAPAPLDLAGMPRFVPPRLAVDEALAGTPVDLGLLGLEALLAFALGFVGFLRYDVR